MNKLNKKLTLFLGILSFGALINLNTVKASDTESEAGYETAREEAQATVKFEKLKKAFSYLSVEELKALASKTIPTEEMAKLLNTTTGKIKDHKIALASGLAAVIVTSSVGADGVYNDWNLFKTVYTNTKEFSIASYNEVKAKTAIALEKTKEASSYVSTKTKELIAKIKTAK